MVADRDSEKTDRDLADQYGYKKDFRTAIPQFLAVSVKNLLLLGYGMTLGFPTILIPAVSQPIEEEQLSLYPSQVAWISSINLIVVPLGCALSGAVTAPMGRRRAMQFVNLPFFVAWLMFHFSTTPAHLYGALFLTGLAGGLLEAPVLTYVAEITQPHLRGAFTATSSMCIIIGVFTQFLFGLFMYWRTVALVNIIFTILAVIALFFVPESPHWLVSRKRYDEAKSSLQWLRGWTHSSAVEKELRDIQALYKNKKVQSEDSDETIREKLSYYLERTFLIPFFLVSYCFFIGHFSGMTTLQTYAVSIFQMLEAPIDKYYATLILGIVQILGSSACVALVHYTGKRPLAVFSTAGAGICCVLVAAYDGYIQMHSVPEESITDTDMSGTLNSDIARSIMSGYSWIPTSLLLMLAFITHTGIRLLPWILIGEVFSAKTRSGGAGLASGAGYIFGFLTNRLYVALLDNISIRGTYGLYGAVSLTGCLVLYFILPETEGKELGDIENHFAGIKKLGNEVYRPPKKTKEVTMTHLKGASNPTFEGDDTHM
ncbi:facilitated trehalose transporter Tret1-like [Cydia pomonella]|uniref:facilitated trehalose transporter Tret1-like n=1 Tax=Cydia pomonella TaxID=82600 RepID=UPI002ADDD23D|nr:facilitated trehalose transporter Tret1-like [Cydia pomonella]XP_061704532.1 facilitated trehalose transporter Tret1-like [Cydia pomonella]XP_061704539.1 facilitated trehalose transporter Tret1-like [Cydia pomonella]